MRSVMANSNRRVWAFCTLLISEAVIIACVAVMVRSCPAGSYSRAAVAADSPTCSRIGRDILQRGGSAVDGAIAALLCTSLINAQSMGLGGGSIFTVMDSSGEVKVINSKETVPRHLKPDLLQSCPKTMLPVPAGSQWIAVPGELRGYEVAHRLYGKLPWATLFQPTIQLAREGFPIPPIQGRYIWYTDSNDSLPLRKFFSDENGNMLKTGDIVKFEKLADTLEIVARDGAQAFYTGKIAEDLIADIQEAGGIITLQDLAEYKAVVTDAWLVPLGEYQMHIPPPPAGGILLSLVLNILKGYNFTSADMQGKQKIQTYHRFIEAFKFVNGLKKRVHDPRFSPHDTAEKLKEESFADHIRSLITNETHTPQYYNITPYLDTMGTSHMSVLAEDGSAVSVTSSLNYMFGSRVYSPKTGVILNNQLYKFCGRNHSFSPGERLPSSTAPSVLKSPSKTLLIGASGGSMIPTGIASALMNHLWFGKSLKEAIAAPVPFVNFQNAVAFEPKFDEDVIEALKALGHEQGYVETFYNVVNAVEKTDGCICAVSDTRKMGEPAGY